MDLAKHQGGASELESRGGTASHSPVAFERVQMTNPLRVSFFCSTL